VSLNYITSTLSYLPEDGFESSKQLTEKIQHFLEEKAGVYFNEIYKDVALRGSIQTHLFQPMNTLFSEKFITYYLSELFNEPSFLDENRKKLPRFIFIETGQQEILQFTDENGTYSIGDINYLHQETSALANALGLILTERDNYPGGKQKVAFSLIDATWSALNSKLPLIFY